MKQVWRIGRLGLAMLVAATMTARAAGPPKSDPYWPCHQAKVVEFPLASVWDGPPIDTSSTAWRDDPAAAGLVALMSQRRAPIAEVQAAVGKLAADPKAKQIIAEAFGAAFEELVRQRSEIIAGLDRFGRKQREMADRIRAENETAHQDEAPVGTENPALQKLEWDLRIFDERRRTVSFVCEAPQAIEARIGEIVKVVRAAL
jgi:hypothetical protein